MTLQPSGFSVAPEVLSTACGTRQPRCDRSVKQSHRYSAGPSPALGSLPQSDDRLLYERLVPLLATSLGKSYRLVIGVHPEAVISMFQISRPSAGHGQRPTVNLALAVVPFGMPALARPPLATSRAPCGVGHVTNQKRAIRLATNRQLAALPYSRGCYAFSSGTRSDALNPSA